MDQKKAAQVKEEEVTSSASAKSSKTMKPNPNNYPEDFVEIEPSDDAVDKSLTKCYGYLDEMFKILDEQASYVAIRNYNKIVKWRHDPNKLEWEMNCEAARDHNRKWSKKWDLERIGRKLYLLLLAIIKASLTMRRGATTRNEYDRPTILTNATEYNLQLSVTKMKSDFEQNAFGVLKMIKFTLERQATKIGNIRCDLFAAGDDEEKQKLYEDQILSFQREYEMERYRLLFRSTYGRINILKEKQEEYLIWLECNANGMWLPHGWGG